MRKPRILYVGEFTKLATGYSVYGSEILRRLHETGKYELGELACYAAADDPRFLNHGLPWTVFPGMPAASDPKAWAAFRTDKMNEFGQWAFEDVCLKFKPDIVVDIRDHWMMSFAETSPFRRFYHWVIMPTVDATPQQEQWIATYINADAVFTYSDWGFKTLQQEGGGLIKLRGSASPGADLDTFFPMDRKAIRRIMHIEDDAFIIGTVMRNQGRKLYPELMESFAKFLKQAPPELAKKTTLYLHTSYPDQGWDIPRLIKQHGLGHKVLMTYKCQHSPCATVFPAFFMDSRGACPNCGRLSAFIPNVQAGVDRSTLAKIMNLFDVYVQYANSEGFGMPQVEAASCGVPVFATDYSAMSDVVRKVYGQPIKVDRLILEGDFGCYRAWPDNQDFIDKLIKHFSKPEYERLELGKRARIGVERHYRWEDTAKQWEDAFDSLPLRPIEETWHSSPRVHRPLKPPDTFSSNEEFVRWCIINIFGREEWVNSYLEVRLVRDLNWGKKVGVSSKLYHNESSFTSGSAALPDFNEQNLIEELAKLCEHWNQWEKRRFQSAGLKPSDKP
jgi:glycosyltransferase involved in cell wall biosynthesis